MDFSRQNIFVSEQLQKEIEEIKILIVGVGLGSFIAECLVRLGVKNLIIADGDVVELTNLNRQNYKFKDIGKNKSLMLKDRLLSINPLLNIQVENKFLLTEDLETLVPQVHIVINTIDFDHPSFMTCNSICKKNNILEIFPLNVGLGTAVFVFGKNTPSISNFFGSTDYNVLKYKIFDHVVENLKNKDKFMPYFNKYLETVGKKGSKEPQIGIGSFITAAVVSTIIVKYLKKDTIKFFPEYYQVSTEFDI